MLTAWVTRKILTRGETPFLHVWADNTAAIRLYEQIGFAVRVNQKLLAVAKP